MKTYVHFAVIVSIAASVSTKSYAQRSGSDNLNISFLLDLSDRISPIQHPNATMPFYKRDVEYIKSIERAFMTHIKTKKIIKLNDQMQVFFDPAPADPAINAMSRSLKVKIDKNISKATLSAIDKTFAEVPQKIYLSAIKTKKYVGSDIYSFFQKKVRNYCIEPNHRNILVILTDGYMYHVNSKFFSGNMSSYITPAYIKSKKLTTINFEAEMNKNKIGFIPATSGLKDLEVIVIGINPANSNPFEDGVINKFWADWFKAMGIKNYYLNGTDLPADIDPILQKIIGGDVQK
jgi:hypothetical protein